MNISPIEKKNLCIDIISHKRYICTFDLSVYSVGISQLFKPRANVLHKDPIKNNKELSIDSSSVKIDILIYDIKYIHPIIIAIFLIINFISSHISIEILFFILYYLIPSLLLEEYMLLLVLFDLIHFYLRSINMQPLTLIDMN